MQAIALPLNSGNCTKCQAITLTYSHLAQLVQKRTIASVNIYSLLIDLRRQAKLLPLINLTPYLCIQYHGEGALSLNNLGDDNVVNSKYYLLG